MKRIFCFVFAAALMLCCDKPVTPDGPVTPETGGTPAPVFYEANPRLFAASNRLPAIISRIDEIKALGTDVLWLMPINTYGKEKSVGSPYCIKDYRSVDPANGTLSDLKDLVSWAHSRDMKVSMDWVANHTSWDCAWISQHKDWYTQDGKGNIVSPPGTNWTDVADLNFDNKSMRQEMIASMVYWIKEAGIDGFRFDHVDGVPFDFWKEALAEIKKADPDAILLAESSDSRCFSSGFTHAFGWPSQTALKNLIQGKTDVQSYLKSIDKEASQAPDGCLWLRFTTNHDQASEDAPATVYKNAEGALAAFVLTAFSGQSPLIYSSQELGYPSALSFFDVRPMAWTSSYYSASLKAYKRIMASRQAAAKAITGTLKSYVSGSVLSLFWTSGDKKLFVRVNTSPSETTVKSPMERTGEHYPYSDTGEAATVDATVTLPGYGYSILYN